jgi:hypothetical protein
MRSRSGAVRATLLSAALLALAVDSRSDDGVNDATAAPVRSCLDRPIVVAYLHHFQDQVMRHWAIDDDSVGDQQVIVHFRLAEDGSLLTYKLVSWTSRRIADAADLAMRHAGPFGPVPDSATCVIGRSIEMQFENPY